MEAKELKRIKDLEEENARLKNMYANLALDLEMAKYIIEKSSKALRETFDYRGFEICKSRMYRQGVPGVEDQQKKLQIQIKE